MQCVKEHKRVSLTLLNKTSEGGGKYLGPGLVRGPEILVKHLVMGAIFKRVGGL